ncbi:DUF2059 domain-containing protein [Hansschlegelia sp. KR7-227]|jgi:hypothetical protein|uniref:DUF2059 domain-containing protein n=1 Tax=Hansschlegelia sp. KR7-227 TaxID=3400914 RepID=UPI003C02C1E7
MTSSQRLRRVAATAALFAMAQMGAAHAQAPAPDAQQLAAAREVFKVSGAEQSLDNIVPIFMDEAKRTLSRTRPELSKDLDAVMATLTPEFEKRREALMNDIATVYAQRFTAKELEEITAFYKTPTGAKLVDQLPGILQASYDRTQVWSRQMSQDIITRVRQELKKRGQDM